MKFKKLLSLALAVVMVCAVSTTAWAEEDTSSLCITYNLKTGDRTQKTIVASYNLPDSAPAVFGSGEMGELIDETTSANLPTPKYGIVPYSYDDNWTNVSSTTSFPYRAIAYLVIHFSDRVETGTGFMIAPGKILTAAHCLYNLDGDTPTSIDVSFGKNGNSAYKTVTAQASSFTVNNMWDSNLNADYDYGVITVPTTISNSTGHFGYNLNISTDTSYTLAGYPNDQIKYFGRYLYKDSGTILDYDDMTTFHGLNSCGGVSGAPLYSSDNKAVGIHTWSGSGGTATRITSDVIYLVQNA